MMPNGRGQPQGMPTQQVGPANSALQATQVLLNSGINPSALTPEQFQQFQGQNQAGQTKALPNYITGLAQHQQRQMPNKSIANPRIYYNTSEISANRIQPGAVGQPNSGGGNHALRDYQRQLMLLELQNKKRLMPRQEQEGMPRDAPID
jgi:hypothetical protein